MLSNQLYKISPLKLVVHSDSKRETVLIFLFNDLLQGVYGQKTVGLTKTS